MTAPSQAQAEVPTKAWESAIRRAQAGDARWLLELLVEPEEIDGGGAARVWRALPADEGMRHRIVRTLIFTLGKLPATTIAELMTMQFGGGKPTVSDLEVDAAKMAAVCAAQDAAGRGGDPARAYRDALADAADANGISLGQLQRRIRAREKKPPG